MFPTIGHLFSYLTGVSLHLPVATFGFFMVLSFAGAWWSFRSEYKRKEAEGLIGEAGGIVHPYQLMDRLLLACGITGFAGAILFSKLEGVYGLNYYGALIAGALTYLYINRKHGISLAIAADIGSPGMMLAYGIGRIGCHLAGDGDWGIVNEAPKPAWLRWAPEWVWGFRYPHNSIHQGMYIPGCPDNYCTVLPAPVYPTPFYEAVLCIILFFVLWALRRKIKTAGVLFAVYALLNGAERFTIEFIRVNPRYSIGAWKLSQAQWLALGWIAVGLIAMILALRQPKSG